MSHFTRHLNKPKPPEPLWLRIISYTAAGIIFMLGGFVIVLWNYARAREEMRPFGHQLRDAEDEACSPQSRRKA